MNLNNTLAIMAANSTLEFMDNLFKSVQTKKEYTILPEFMVRRLFADTMVKEARENMPEFVPTCLMAYAATATWREYKEIIPPTVDELAAQIQLMLGTGIRWTMHIMHLNGSMETVDLSDLRDRLRK